MEIMDGNASTLLQILSTLYGVYHSTVGVGEATVEGNKGDSRDGGAYATGVGDKDDSGLSMHMAMDEGSTPVEEEVSGDDVDTETTMHEAMEESGTLVKVGREEGDMGATVHKHIELGGTIVKEEVVYPMTFSTSQFIWPCFRPIA
jgi:hypothetical protein